MYEVTEIEDYREKWLEAERELAISWREHLIIAVNYEPVDQADKKVEPVETPIVQVS